MNQHRVKKHGFGRRQGPKIALLKGLVGALVEHGRIKTTLAKAKELRRHVERAITKGKRAKIVGELHTLRNLTADFSSEVIAKKILSDLAPRFKDRPGGYTRILKLGQRLSDAAPIAYIEFVDFQPKAKSATVDASGAKEARGEAKKKIVLRSRTKKHIRRVSVRSKRLNRA